MKRTQDQPPGIPTLIHRCRLKSPPATNRLKTRRRNENEKKKERDADDIRAAKPLRSDCRRRPPTTTITQSIGSSASYHHERQRRQHSPSVVAPATTTSDNDDNDHPTTGDWHSFISINFRDHSSASYHQERRSLSVEACGADRSETSRITPL
ncbi:hypothetical protein KSS87_009518 [Heliosperma pusillum]|nr:hypothetical protein KSS87_009518 [Heliosperma pusillum]